jgi:hypothetical protein
MSVRSTTLRIKCGESLQLFISVGGGRCRTGASGGCDVEGWFIVCVDQDRKGRANSSFLESGSAVNMGISKISQTFVVRVGIHSTDVGGGSIDEDGGDVNVKDMHSHVLVASSIIRDGTWSW